MVNPCTPPTPKVQVLYCTAFQSESSCCTIDLQRPRESYIPYSHPLLAASARRSLVKLLLFPFPLCFCCCFPDCSLQVSQSLSCKPIHNVLGLLLFEYSFKCPTKSSNSCCFLFLFSKLLFCRSGLYLLKSSSSVGET